MAPTTITIGVMVATLAVIIAFGFAYGKMKLEGVEGFLSGRETMGVSLGLGTFIAYAAGSGLLFSPPESGARLGLPAVIGYGFAIAAPFFVYFTVGPKIRERMPKGHTIPEYAKIRFGRPMYALTMVVTLFYMFILMTANLTGVALALKQIAGVPTFLTLVLVMGAVMIYTIQGGLLSAIFTDLIQAVVIIPVLVISILLAVIKLGGPIDMFTQMQSTAPAFVDITNPAGVRFAVYIVIALIGAEMLNQSLWQRAHAAKDSRTLRVSFIGAAVAVVPMWILAGLYGVIASGLAMDFVSPSAALPTVIEATLGTGAQIAFIVMILLVITSTLDNALSAIVSILAVDVVPLVNDVEGDRLLRISRILTFAMAIVGMGIAALEPSVLFLLLRADLLAAATVVPILTGLFTKRLGGTTAFLAALIAILSGIPWFLAQNYLFSFGTALLVSTLIVVLGMGVRPADFSFEKLAAVEELE